MTPDQILFFSAFYGLAILVHLLVTISDLYLCYSYPKLPYKLETFVDVLVNTIPGLHLWAAGINDDANVPQSLQRQLLDVALRSAPSVVREVEAGIDDYNQRWGSNVQGYAAHDHAATPGATVKEVRHDGQGHINQSPSLCGACGTETAKVIIDLINAQGAGEALTLR